MTRALEHRLHQLQLALAAHRDMPEAIAPGAPEFWRRELRRVQVLLLREQRGQGAEM